MKKKSLGHQLGDLATDPDQGETPRILALTLLLGQDSRSSWQKVCHETPATRAHYCVPVQCQLSVKGVPQDALLFLASLTLRLVCHSSH